MNGSRYRACFLGIMIFLITSLSAFAGDSTTEVREALNAMQNYLHTICANDDSLEKAEARMLSAPIHKSL